MGDIRQATAIARKMITEWGMNDRLGFVFYGEDDQKMNFMGMPEGREYSEETAKIIDEEVKKLIDRLFDETRQLLESHRERIEALAQALMKHETLDSSDIDRLMRGDSLNKKTIAELLEAEQRRPGTVIQPGDEKSQPDIQLGGGPLPAPG
jgi:cell division protease FtsH